MIVGAHAVIYSTDPEADRAFFRDVLGLEHVDAGGGWLIFALPPSEAAFHPAEAGRAGGRHELYLMCSGVERFVARMGERGVPCTPVHEEPWGAVVSITLPGGSALGVYEPRHARPGAGG